MNSSTGNAIFVAFFPGGIEYTPPFVEPIVVFDGDKLTATTEGVFVGYWERLK